MADKRTIGPWTRSPVSLPPNRRYILTHDSNGKSIVYSSPPQLYHGRPGVGGMARSYAIPSIPVNMTNDVDIAAYLSPESGNPVSHKGTDIVVPTGKRANLVVVDLAPGGESQMHRTVSIDFSICVLGQVCMELDGGERLELKPGDHVIQRGTLHKWYNPSKTEAARFVAVTLPCEPFEIPGTGKMLTEEHLDVSGAQQQDGSKL